MLNAVWVFVGGGLGTLARWGASGFIANRFGQTFHEPGGARLRRALTDSCGWEIRARRSLAPPFMVQMRDSRTVEAPHEPCPLIPSFSPSGGRRCRRAVEGVSDWFMASTHVRILEVFASHEPDFGRD